VSLSRPRREAHVEAGDQRRSGAVPLANEEAGTSVWFALRSDETTFWIVDAFPREAERQAHLSGPLAAALIDNADRLLAAPPEINPSEVLAAKVS
jgi:quinol monooxygenase YgiN